MVNVVNAVDITLEFAVSVSCSVDVLSDGAVDLLMDVLAGLLIIVVIGGVSEIDIDVLVDMNINGDTFAVVKTEVKFATPGPLY